MPPNDGMPGGPMPPGFFSNSTMRPSPPTHPSSQPSPHPQPPPPHSQMMSSQPFMGPRYSAGPRPGVRMPQLSNDFNGPPGQPIMPNSLDPTRQGEAGEFVGWQGPGMGGMNPRMNPPRGPGGMGPMAPGQYGGPGGMRGPPPGGAGPGPGGMPPMSMTGPGGRPQWQPNTSTPMTYSSSSPGKFQLTNIRNLRVCLFKFGVNEIFVLGNYGGPPGSAGPPGPGTPIMPSPQDSSNSGGENMYTLMKPAPGGNLGNDFPMGGGPDGSSMGPMGPNTMGPVLNSDGLEGMKNSPANGGPGTPREDSGSGMGDYNLSGFGGPGENDQNESAAILKIKESMQEEAKRFEKDSDHPDYYMN